MLYTYLYLFLRYLPFYVKFDIFSLQNNFNLHKSEKVYFLGFCVCPVKTRFVLRMGAEKRQNI